MKSVNRNTNKLKDFEGILANSRSDCIMISESWLNDSISDAEIPSLGYDIYRKDRRHSTKERGGGLLCAVKNNIISLRRAELEPDDEIMVIEVRPNKGDKIALVLCYRAPDEDLANFTTNLDTTTAKLFQSFKQLLVVGDFNVPDLKGCFDYSSGSEVEHSFLNTIDSYFLKQVNHIPSRSSNDNILDLVFTSDPDRISDVTISSEYFNTDHKLLEFTLGIRVERLKSKPRFVYNFKAANFDEVRSNLSTADFSDVYDASDVNVAWSAFCDTFVTVLDNLIPKVKVKDATAPAWIDGDVRHLKNKKETAWRRAKKSNLPHHWATFRKLRNKYKNLLAAKYNSYISSLGAMVGDNPKRFWSFFRCKTQSKSLPKVIHSGNVTASSPKDKAEMFNKYFFSVFSQPKVAQQLPDIPMSQHQLLGRIEVTEDDVLEILKNLDVSKAIGPDGISPRVLKECAHQIVSPLCHIFNMSLRTGILPGDWLKANVVPVFKKSDKQQVENYRPVSLLCVCGKVMERAIFNTVFPVIKKQLYHLQHGFVKGRSTTTQLLTVFHEISSVLDNAGQVDMIYLDFSKAFDSVSHKLLVHKLQSFGIHSDLLNWFSAYLSGREQRVVVEGIQSDWLPVISGVPQGSILGPLLFLLYINDMPSVAQHTSLALFADDSKCYKKISHISDCVQLQNDIDALFEWSQKWDLKFHPSKCQIICVTRKRNVIEFDYKMNGVTLERINSIKDLGIDISSTLVWDDHVNRVVAKCNKKLGMIKRAIGFTAPPNVSKTLYAALIRSDLEYGSSVWSGTSKHNIEVLERVQRRATKFILGYPNLDYRDRLSELSLLPLTYRREISDLNCFFRCKLGQYDLFLNNYVQFYSSNQSRRITRLSSDHLKLIPPRCKTESHMSNFFQRIVPIWNQLPFSTRASESVAVFKSSILDFFKDKFVCSFNPDDVCTWISACRCPRCRF
jgi:hypothetical protein